MCGISGIIYQDRGRQVAKENLRRMCHTLAHRGPDDEGFYLRDHVGLGMTRLSIIDLESGHQPISNEDGSIWIICNGEIYNHPDLRRDLEARGHRFRTESDIEVVVHAYEEKGEACVNRLNGMFAFAIWDKGKQRLILGRDRLGKKPLYYLLDGEKLIFGSEIKAILAYPGVNTELDLEALDAYLTLEYVPVPLSIFKGIKKLPSGHLLVLDKHRAQIKKYWELKLESEPLSTKESEERLLDLLRDAVRIRLKSDVSLGALLSGGIDSSATVALMSQMTDRPIKTFSVGFEDRSYNELHFAKRVSQCFQTEHHETIVDPKVAYLAEKLLRHLDEPLADFSTIPTYLVTQFARGKVKVALSGDGGDEIFAGYETYVADKLDRAYRKLPAFIRQPLTSGVAAKLRPSPKKKGTINRLKRFTEGAILPAELQHTRWMIAFSEAEKAALSIHGAFDGVSPGRGYGLITDYFKAAEFADPLKQQQYVDINSYLPDNILVKVDRMSMANSLEVRSPLLDYRLVEFALNLPPHMKMKGIVGKYLLRKVMSGTLPKEILNRGKEGFSIPIKNWLRGELRELMLDMLSEERIKREGLFSPRYIQQLISEHLNGRQNHSHRLWSLMAFELWSDEYLR